jgi:hypothetical protein
MTWTKLGAEFPDAAATLADAAFRTHVEALCWSNRRLLDQVIPKRQLHRFTESEHGSAAVTELVATGWWEDRGDTWFIGVHFADWQRDRVQVENNRKRNAEEQRRSRRHKLGDHSLCPDTKPCRRGGSAPDTAPDPEQNKNGTRSGAVSEHDTNARDLVCGRCGQPSERLVHGWCVERCLYPQDVGE